MSLQLRVSSFNCCLMPPMYLRSNRRYHLGYFSDEWEHAPPATRTIAELYRRHACKRARDWDEASMSDLNPGHINLAGRVFWLFGQRGNPNWPKSQKTLPARMRSHWCLQELLTLRHPGKRTSWVINKKAALNLRQDLCSWCLSS